VSVEREWREGELEAKPTWATGTIYVICSSFAIVNDI
jgi:hypothetical protein